MLRKHLKTFGLYVLNVKASIKRLCEPHFELQNETKMCGKAISIFSVIQLASAHKLLLLQLDDEPQQ